MTSRSQSRVARLAIWLGVAILGALTGATLQLVGVGAGSGSAVAPHVADQRAGSIQTEGTGTAAPTVGGPLAVVAPVAGPAIEAEDEPSTAETASTGTVTRPAAPPSGFRLRVPAIGVDAQIVVLGFLDDGQLAVPGDGGSVGWYEISSGLGEPGNALLGAHFDWDGALAVFSRLDQLSAGDRVFLDSGAGAWEYEVSVASSVGWDHPFADILAADGTSSSLTLFTCGGAFDSARSEYDERLVVRAVLVDSSAPLTARR